MYNAWYRNNETYVGPLGRNNELTLDMRAFLDYARQVKSSSNPNAKKVQRDTNLLLEERLGRGASRAAADAKTKYTLNEFLVGQTRMHYYDNSNYLGFPAAPYTSSIALQNFERLVINPDIGYYVERNGGDSGFNHSDFTRKYSPQEALNRVLSSPLFNGNSTKTILQSNKSERYYQLTFPLENCGRMYVMAAPMIPCYSVVQPWAHVCRLFQMNPELTESATVVSIDRFPEWLYLRDEYRVDRVILLPNSISLMNRRDPVIQEGSIELVTTIFTYDTCDSDIQFNNPYGCFNKHEDYDGDTNTQSVGKGVESNVEIYFNMKRQMLPCLRAKSIVPQNVLTRVMLYFVRDVDPTFPHDRHARELLGRELFDDVALHSLGHNHDVYVRLASHVDRCMDAGDIVDEVFHHVDETEEMKVLAVELLRRACICLEHLSNSRRIARNRGIARRVFGRDLLANLYVAYVARQRRRIVRKVRTFAAAHLSSPEGYARLGDTETRNLLHEMLQLWAPVSISLVSNCQTLLDDVFRSTYCALGERACTDALNYLCRVAHQDFPNFFLDRNLFDLEYIVNVLSRAKGDFDSLLRMAQSVHRYVRTSANDRFAERSRHDRLPLGKRDFFTRIDDRLLDKYIDYTDKYVLGSKKIPKSCKQANSMKWAMQNVQYYEGDLWINGEIMLEQVQQYFSAAFFFDTNLLRLVLDRLRAPHSPTTVVDTPCPGESTLPRYI